MVSYFLPDILGMKSVLVCNLTREYMRTPGFSSGVAILAVDMVTSGSHSANYDTAG